MVVIDDLDTQSSTDALSANMGYELNDRLINVEFSIFDIQSDISIINSSITNFDARITNLENSNKTRIWDLNVN